MARIRLHNETWGFDSNCFVCEPKNPMGMALPFFHDDQADTVVADFTLGAEFSGAPSYVHGGVTLAVLDEAQAWATIALAGKFAVTTETTTRFKRPVLVGEPYSVTARITDQTADVITTSAEVRNAAGERCADTTAVFTVLSAATAVDALGVEAPDAGYLKD
ncbi:hypothetical protein BH20ACT2_BH20ACT2_13070 [soil metagenome]